MKRKGFLVLYFIILTFISGCGDSQTITVSPQTPTPQGFIKKGTIALDIVEVTPFVFNGRLYRVE